jgi:hypothetical protein
MKLAHVKTVADVVAVEVAEADVVARLSIEVPLKLIQHNSQKRSSMFKSEYQTNVFLCAV